jgi:hypothetical protein
MSYNVKTIEVFEKQAKRLIKKIVLKFAFQLPPKAKENLVAQELLLILY